MKADLDIVTSPQPPDTAGYVRLTHVDRLSAEGLSQFCETSGGEQTASAQLANTYFWQSLRTGTTLALADFFTLWVLLFGSSGVTERLLGLPTTLVENRTALFSALLVLPVAYLVGLYPGLGMSPIVEFRQIVRAGIVSLLVFAGIGLFCFPEYWHFYAVSSLIAFAGCVPCFPAARYIVRKISSLMPIWGAPVLIYAPWEVATEMYHRLDSLAHRGLRPVGILLSPNDQWASEQSAEDSIPTFDIREAEQAALAHHVSWVLVADHARADAEELMPRELAAIPNRILMSISTLDLGLWDSVYTVGTFKGVRVGGNLPHASTLTLKRGLDLGLTIPAMILLAPFLATVALLIRCSSRGPILFGQRRVGKGGHEFTAWKFRTMVGNASEVLDAYLASHPEAQREWIQTHKLRNDPRVTAIGRFLRTTSLDELPQLWNIVVGEMSLVGPRPIVDSPTYDASYIEEYPDEFEVYKTVRPGLTGLWQISCRNNGVYELRIYWDMYYIRHWSLWLDGFIILRTFRTVLLREGTS